MATDRSVRTRLLRGSALTVAAAAVALAPAGAALADETTTPPPPASSKPAAPPPSAKPAPTQPVTEPDDETSGPGWEQTNYGPLGPADRDLLVKVRQAGLWEMPMGDEAQVRAAAPRVKEVGRLIMKDHEVLDTRVKKVAATLGVPLPDEASADQQGWMAELRGATGEAFDQLFADRLRAAHGKVFTVVAAVRSGSRNNLVREFAQEGINAVMRHMTLLESTKLVNFQDLPLPPGPAAAPPPSAAPSTSAGAAAPPGTTKAPAAPKPSVRAKPTPAAPAGEPVEPPQQRDVANASSSSWADDAGGGGMILLVLLLCTGLAAATIGVVRFVQSR
ncbi:DUF4142 domain-containing protein [Crossiella sp. SN42]|uniref:DUF4142 domain-containing protein n=1 Tax=Crossiella sp. SN42 TaxID=2944808 RepID=UPI00207C6375|nr:DUF4142 domain-containing protein [Crossiella sp. SN42]MCO1578844.1 DUF4142 domain-containing protein [Crossiella sp. SN42]